MARSEPLPRAWHVVAKLVLYEKIVYGKGAKNSPPPQDPKVWNLCVSNWDLLLQLMRSINGGGKC